MSLKMTVAGVAMAIAVSVSPASGAGSLDALDVLATIPVQKENPAGYSRDLFPHWRDIDGDGCDAREQVLKRDSTSLPQVDPYKCFVVEGDWYSPYDGRTVGDRTQVDIDHVVALKEAWDSGAWGWTTELRIAYANDTSDRRTLVAASATSNRSKSDKDPSNWLPTRASYVCTYVTNWVSIKARWGLSMDQSEFGRVRNVLRSQCPGATISPWRVVRGLPITNSISPTSTMAPANTSTNLVYPGAWCAPEGARGVAASGVQYVCSKTSLSGQPYGDGRPRWRRTS